MKTALKIAENNYSKINSALAEVNGKAWRNVLRFPELLALADRAEKELHMLRKKTRVGVRVTYTPAGPRAAYQYAMRTTRVTIVRRATGWFLTECEREDVYPRAREQFQIDVSEDQAAEICAVALSPFTVKSPDEFHNRKAA